MPVFISAPPGPGTDVAMHAWVTLDGRALGCRRGPLRTVLDGTLASREPLMGGLAALFLDRGAPVDRDLFHRVCTAVPCRSADGTHVWHGDGASLARLRFVTSDEDDAIAVDTASQSRRLLRWPSRQSR